jgi:hypothetical protein
MTAKEAKKLSDKGFNDYSYEVRQIFDEIARVASWGQYHILWKLSKKNIQGIAQHLKDLGFSVQIFEAKQKIKIDWSK